MAGMSIQDIPLNTLDGKPASLNDYEGKAILLVSADLDEIRALADRVLVIERGRLAGELAPTAGDREFGLMMGAA